MKYLAEKTIVDKQINAKSKKELLKKSKGSHTGTSRT